MALGNGCTIVRCCKLVAAMGLMKHLFFTLFVYHFGEMTTSTRNKGVLQSSPRQIYVDLGANCGNSYFHAKRGHKPGSNETLKYPSPDAWEAYLWECSPQMIEWYLHDLVKNESNVTLIPNATSVSNGKATFYVTAGQENLQKHEMPNAHCNPSSLYNPGGASTLFIFAKHASKTQNYTMEMLDFLKWHMSLGLQEGDTVHMKMDIKRPEMDIIDKFMNNDTTIRYVFGTSFGSSITQKSSKRAPQLTNRTRNLSENFPDSLTRSAVESCGLLFHYDNT